MGRRFFQGAAGWEEGGKEIMEYEQSKLIDYEKAMELLKRSRQYLQSINDKYMIDDICQSKITQEIDALMLEIDRAVEKFEGD